VVDPTAVLGGRNARLLARCVFPTPGGAEQDDVLLAIDEAEVVKSLSNLRRPEDASIAWPRGADCYEAGPGRGAVPR
jgi:hypothetical protein